MIILPVIVSSLLILIPLHELGLTFIGSILVWLASWAAIFALYYAAGFAMAAF